MTLAVRVQDEMRQAFDELAALVGYRSVADARQFPPEECARAATLAGERLESVGLSVELVETTDGSLAVLGEAPAPPGAPTVLLYAHYDVQPPGDESAWTTPPFVLRVGDDGRWYGRGAADCKGNVLAHLLALRALRAEAGTLPVGVKVVLEGSEEQGGEGLADLLHVAPHRFAADAIVIADSGNVEVGVPTLTTTLRGVVNAVVTLRTLEGPLHSGSFGGAAPDALAALVRLLSTFRDAAGDTRVDGIPNDQRFPGADYPPDRFARDAGVLPAVSVVGSGTVADALWARPALTILGIDCPAVVGSAAAIQGSAAARINLRVPPGVDATAARAALDAHLRRHTPWGARVEVAFEGIGQPFTAPAGGPADRLMRQALEVAYHHPVVTVGQGGSIPLCNDLHAAHPAAELLLIGVEDAAARIHAPNESVDPAEIERTAIAEAHFLQALAGDITEAVGASEIGESEPSGGALEP